MARLIVVVPEGRAYCGRAALVAADGSTVVGPMRALATASRRVARKHGNPTCDPTQPFGHPAAGSYEIVGSLPPQPQHRRARRFGHLGALVLEASEGQARLAAEAGRPRCVLHGGPTDGAGRLRRTRGGIRVSDRDLATLLGAINERSAAGDPVVALDLVELPSAAAAESPDDLPGGKLAPRKRRGARSLSTPARGQRLFAPTAMAVLAVGVGARDGEKAPTRRQFLVGAAALLAGALGGGACEKPSYCEPVACDPTTDASCPPEGYTCVDPSNYVAAGGVG